MLSCVTLLLLSPVETETSPRGLLEAALDLAHGVYTSGLVGGMGGLGRGRSGRPPGSTCLCWVAVHTAPEQASTDETAGLVSARTSPAPACDARDPCNCSPTVWLHLLRFCFDSLGAHEVIPR